MIIDIHCNKLGNSHFSISILPVPLSYSESCQIAFVKITRLRQYIGTHALEIKLAPIKGSVMRVTRSHTLAILSGVAAMYSIYKLTAFVWTTFGLLARDCASASTDTFLSTLGIRIEDRSFLVVATLVGASTVTHRHTFIPT